MGTCAVSCARALPGCNADTKWGKSRKEVKLAYFRKYGHRRPDVEHVVVLMLENRTFDNVLGCWMDRRMKKKEVKPSKWDVHCSKGRGLYDYTNVVLPRRADADEEESVSREVIFPVWSRDSSKEDIMSTKALGMPNGEPAEKFQLLNLCVFEDDDPGEDDQPTLGGFAQEYYEREMHDLEELNDEWGDRTDFENKRSPAMHVFLPEQVQVFTDLAENFGVSDTYFSSAPCQTWPNRLFAACGHCYGYVNNLSDRGEAYDHDKMNVIETMSRLVQFNHETVFDRLEKAGQEWAVFFGDYPLSMMINRSLHESSNLGRSYPISDFKKACKAGSLPPYTWLEPQYLAGVDGSPPNDMHPPHNILYAQHLVADIYNNLRESEELWQKTVLIITCDEGVGVFDHVPPPAAPDPKAGYNHAWWGQEDPRNMKSNPFKRYGTRVPLIVASPLIEEGAVLRPPENSEYPFDHASILRTVFDLFVHTDCSLTNRDKQAPSLAPLLNQKPRKKGGLGPKTLKLVRDPPKMEDPKCGRPNKSERGGCHSLQHLIPGAAGGQSAMFRANTGIFGDSESNLLVEQMQDLFAQFGTGGRADKHFHWIPDNEKDHERWAHRVGEILRES